MRMSKALDNERGAALLMTLFLIMFVSIVGVSLLNTTFYGQKNNVVAVAEQEEFYPLEGAIEMLLFEMKEYKKESNSYLMAKDSAGNIRRVEDDAGNPIRIVNKGTYFYIDDPSTLKSKTYRIAEHDIHVGIEEVRGTGNAYHFTITAKKLTNPRLVREVEIVASRENEPPMLEFDPDKPEIAPFPIRKALLGVNHVKIHHHQANNVGKLNEQFANILRFYEINPADATESLTNNYSFAGKDKHYFKNLATENITIPAGNLVFINDPITLRGGSSLVIDGILLVNSIDIGGNAAVNGAVIANYLSVNSNAVSIGSDAGVDSGGSGGGYKAPSIDITEEDYTWSTEFEKIENMNTDRQ